MTRVFSAALLLALSLAAVPALATDPPAPAGPAASTGAELTQQFTQMQQLLATLQAAGLAVTPYPWA